jgi:hypothetical protein
VMHAMQGWKKALGVLNGEELAESGYAFTVLEGTNRNGEAASVMVLRRQIKGKEFVLLIGDEELDEGLHRAIEEAEGDMTLFYVNRYAPESADRIQDILYAAFELEYGDAVLDESIRQAVLTRMRMPEEGWKTLGLPMDSMGFSNKSTGIVDILMHADLLEVDRAVTMLREDWQDQTLLASNDDVPNVRMRTG